MILDDPAFLGGFMFIWILVAVLAITRGWGDVPADRRPCPLHPFLDTCAHRKTGGKK